MQVAENQMNSFLLLLTNLNLYDLAQTIWPVLSQYI